MGLNVLKDLSLFIIYDVYFVSCCQEFCQEWISFFLDSLFVSKLLTKVIPRISPGIFSKKRKSYMNRRETLARVAGVAFAPKLTVLGNVNQEIEAYQHNVAVIRDYYENLPAASYAEIIVDASTFYGISPALITIIGKRETGGGRDVGRADSWFGLGWNWPRDPDHAGEIWHVAALLSGATSDPRYPNQYARAKEDIERLQVFNSGHIGGWKSADYQNYAPTDLKSLQVSLKPIDFFKISSDEVLAEEDSPELILEE